MTHLRSALAVTAATVMLAGTGLAPAAVAQTSPPKQPQQQAPANFSDDDVESFALASLEVRKITNQYQPRLQAAQSPDERQRVRQEAIGKMTDAVRESGLSIDKFNQISAAARKDPRLAAKIQDKMVEKQ